jgi:hypothetical protein
MQLAPIILFVYNRPLHTALTLEALSKNELAGESVLYIYADGAKENITADDAEKIRETREVIRKKKWCKEIHIIQSDINKGLANSIINGVTQVIDKHGSIIVLEDDLVVSPFFLSYMNGLLGLYEKDEEIISIHGYNYPIKMKYTDTTFLLKGADCWGWATWKRGWDLFEQNPKKLLDEIEAKELSNEFDFFGSYAYTNMLKAQQEGKLDSWAICWYASAFVKNKLTVYPGKSLVSNIGTDGSGTHFNSSGNSIKPGKVAGAFKLRKLYPLVENLAVKEKIAEYFHEMKRKRPSVFQWVKKLYSRN